MSFLGDIAFLIGTIGVVIYLCLIVIRYTSQASRLKAIIRQYEEQLYRVRQKIEELEQKRAAQDPEVNRLLNQMIALRELRDRLSFQYEEMVARSREREIRIKYNIH